MKWLILILGICANAGASVMLKMSVSGPRKMQLFSDSTSIFANWSLWGSLLMYGIAFMFYGYSLTKFPLNIAHPILTSGTVATVTTVSIIVFREPLYSSTVLGILFIIIGVIFLSSNVP